MSIWCSHEDIGFELRWEPDGPQPQGGQVRSYVDGWSNHYPTTDGTAEQPAAIDTAHIAPWCTPGWRDREEECDRMVGPWLRLSLDAPQTKIVSRDAIAIGPLERVSVVMDEDAVRALVADLTAWLETDKVHPE